MERVRAAIRNSGCNFPTRRIVVNLAPADLKKAGPAYDLPMAVVTAENIETIKIFGATPCYVWMPAGQWDLWPVLDTSDIGLSSPTVEMREQLKGY